MVLEELVAMLGFNVTGEAELRRFNQGLENAAAMAARASAVIVAFGAAAAAGMAALGKSVITTSAQFEGYQTSLETIEGSAEKAKQSMDWITQFAAKTPYDLAGVTQAFIRLKSYGIDPMDGTLTTLGDTASAMNKPLMQAVEAYADATSMQFERLREFGLRAEQKGDQVTFSWSKNGKDMTRTVKKTGAEVQKFMKEFFGKSFSGAMVRQSKTWDGVMANLGDSWELFKKRIGDAGFFKHVKGKFAELLDQIGLLDEKGILAGWSKSLSEGLIWGFDLVWLIGERLIRNLFHIGQMVGQLGGKIADFFRWLSDGKIDLGPWQALLAVIGGLLLVLNPAAGAAVLLLVALDDLLTWMRGGNSSIGDMIARLEELGVSFDSVGSAVSTSAKLLGDWFSSVDWSEQGKALGKSLIEGIKSAFSSLSGMLSGIDWSQLGKDIGSAIDFAAIGRVWYAALKATFDLLLGLRQGLIDGLMNIDWAGVVTTWVSALKGSLNLIKGVFDGLSKSIADAILAWFDGINWSEVGTKIKEGILAAVVAVPAAMISLFTGADYTEIGKKIGDGILSGLQSMGGAIKAWFADLLPEWASDFFTWKTEKDGSLQGKAKAEGDRRRFFEQETMPRTGNTPGLKQTLDQVGARDQGADVISLDTARRSRQMGSTDKGKVKADLGDPPHIVSGMIDKVQAAASGLGDAIAAKLRTVPEFLEVIDPVRVPAGEQTLRDGARQTRRIGSTDTLPGKTADDQGVGEKVMSALSNVNAHLARMSGDAAAKAISVTATDARQDNRQYPTTINSTINQTVQGVAQAPAAAAQATSSAVSNAAKNAARIESSPNF